MLKPAPPPRPPLRPRRGTVLGVVLCFLAAVAVIAAVGLPNYRVAADQDVFHLPVIRQFAAQWPRPDLSDYKSATSPGYHLLLAAVEHWTHPGVGVLRGVGGVFGVLLVGLLAYAASARSAWLALPAAFSVYVLSSTVWLLPENAAWLLLTLVLLLALHATGARLLVGGAVTLALLVFVRQSHAWAALPFLAAAAACSLSRYSGGGLGRGLCRQAVDALHARGPLPNPPPEYRERGSDWRFIAFSILALLPMLAVLAWLVLLWHGLTPPAFRPGSGVELTLATKAGGLAPAAAAMTLALIGLFGTPLLAWLTPPDTPPRILRWAAAGVLVGLIAGVAAESTYAPPYRVSGLWNLVQKLPTVAGRSPLIAFLSTLGGGVAMVALSRLPRRQCLVLAVALAGFVLAQTANASVWQRYYEPFVLIWLTLAAAWPTPLPPRQRRSAYAGLIAVAAFQLAVTAYVLSRGS